MTLFCKFDFNVSTFLNHAPKAERRMRSHIILVSKENKQKQQIQPRKTAN